MREYETMVVLRPNTSEREIKELEDRFQNLTKQHKGDVLNKCSLGKKPLPYPMSKEREGIYLHLDFNGEGSVVPEIERILRYDERVIRFMTIAKN